MTLQIFRFINDFKNAQKQGKVFFFFFFSKKILKLLNILKKEGYINYFQVVLLKNGMFFKVFLYRSQENTHHKKFKYVSKAGSFSKKDFWKMPSKIGVTSLNSSNGIISNRMARIKNLGGNFLFYMV